MIKDVARGVLRRCLPVLVALMLTTASGARWMETGRSAVAPGTQHGCSAEQPIEAAVDGDAAAAVAVIDREQILTQQNTVSVGVSRAPPAAPAV